MFLTGVGDLAANMDLLDRSLLSRLPPIPDDRRKTEGEFWATFYSERPRLLGALLDRLAGGLREWPLVLPGRLPRLADFARLAVAAEIGAGGTAERFWLAYDGNRADANEQALDDSPLVPHLRRLMGTGVEWRGSASDLLAKLAELAGTDKPPGWPKRPRDLSDRLRRLAPSLRRAGEGGLDVQTGLREGGRRLITIRKHPGRPRDSAPSAPNAPARPESQFVSSHLVCAQDAGATPIAPAVDGENLGEGVGTGAVGAESRGRPGDADECAEDRSGDRNACGRLFPHDSREWLPPD